MLQAFPIPDPKRLFESIDPSQRPSVLLLLVLSLGLGIIIGRRNGIRDRPYRFGTWRSRSFQNSGEALVTRVLRAHFRAPDYHLMNHVTIQMDDGTTQIDHILVSRFGVFVIETKDFSGWIFANDADRLWTSVHYRQKYRFQNPLRQNFRHVLAVQNVLHFVPREDVHSIVVFSGAAEFKTDIPDGVLHIENLADHIRRYTDERLALNRMQYAVGRLESERLLLTDETDVQHAENLQQRFSGARS